MARVIIVGKLSYYLPNMCVCCGELLNDYSCPVLITSHNSKPYRTLKFFACERCYQYKNMGLFREFKVKRLPPREREHATIMIIPVIIFSPAHHSGPTEFNFMNDDYAKVFCKLNGGLFYKR